MMEENGSKKVLLSVLGVAILVVAVVGISFAAYSATRISGENVISTGTISMSYSEPTNGIELIDALPMSNANGMALTGEAAGKNQTFAFTVSTNASGNLAIPYEISVTPVTVTETATVGPLQDHQVMLYLTKDGTAVTYPATNKSDPLLVSDLAASTMSGRETSKLLYRDTDTHTVDDATTAVTSNYVLRMWIAEQVNVDDITAEGKTFEYRLKVNVDAALDPLA